MIKSKKHIIGLLKFELQVNNKRNAIAVQKTISELSKNDLPRILEPSFDRHDRKDISLVFDRLELDLGNIAYSDFKFKFKNALKKELSQKLSSELADPVKTSDNNEHNVNVESDFHIVEFFLVNGILPWYADGSVLDLRRMTHNLIRRKDSAFGNLIRTQGSNKNFQIRLGQVISESYYKDLFSLLSNSNFWKDDSSFRQYLTLYQYYPFSNEPIKSFRHLLFESIINVLATETLTESLQFEISVFKQLSEKLNISTVQLINRSRESLKKMQKEKQKTELTSYLNLLLHQLTENILTGADTKISKDLVQNKIEKESEKNITSHLVFNAGLVLITPFLKELFEKLELIENENFIDEKAQIKAIHLLQYASIGREGNAEHFLLLNKILCGYHLNKAIQWSINLSMIEKSETTRMLTGAVKNWSALKKTSTTSFRKSFIQRKGILQKTDNDWSLKVERTAYDVLLNKIPWQYERIKLPWMTSKIETVW